MTQLLPEAALESHAAILGKTGSGKTNLSKVVVERLIRAGDRVCVIDPKDDWWGLGLSQDGKRPSTIRPTIFGGNHGDMPLGEHHGAVLAEAIAASSTSTIVVTRLLTSSARTRFFTAFAETLLRVNTGPLYLIIDEAHIFAPEAGKMDLDGAKMLGAANNLVSLGRGYGLRIWLISQRPQKLAKDALTQAETLVAMRLIHPLDVKAVRAWIGEWAQGDTGDEIVKSLPSLPTGDAWVWSPLANYLKRVHAPLATTYDSGKPPSRDAVAPTLAPIDTAELGDKMDAIRQEALANDPKRLKARIAELERQKPVTVVDEKAIGEAKSAGYAEGVDVGFKSGMDAGITAERQRLGQKLLDFAATFALATIEEELQAAYTPPAPVRTIAPKVQTPRLAPKIVANAGGAADPAGMSPSTAKLVDAIVAAYPAGMSLATAAKRAGLSSRSSAYRRYLTEAASSPRIAQRADGKYVAVAAEPGVRAPSGLDDFVRSLPPSAGKMLTAIAANSIPMDKMFIAEVAGISPTSSGLGSGLRELEALGLVQIKDGLYCLHEDFRT